MKTLITVVCRTFMIAFTVIMLVQDHPLFADTKKSQQSNTPTAKQKKQPLATSSDADINNPDTWKPVITSPNTNVIGQHDNMLLTFAMKMERRQSEARKKADKRNIQIVLAYNKTMITEFTKLEAVDKASALEWLKYHDFDFRSAREQNGAKISEPHITPTTSSAYNNFLTAMSEAEKKRDGDVLKSETECVSITKKAEGIFNEERDALNDVYEEQTHGLPL